MTMMMPFNPTQAGVAQGAAAGANLSGQGVQDFANRNALYMSPQQQLQLAQQQANEAALRQQDLMNRNMGVSAGLANQAANANNQRAMVLAAQQNEAANVANQLNALTQARANNAGMIQAAMNAGAGMFR